MLVLASASPRRAELLRNARFEFTVQPADIDETALPQEDARTYAERLAREKALAVLASLDGREDAVVLGADTVVVVDGELLGKPADAEDARRMLRLLSGRAHEVITGVCVARRGEVGVSSECTVVYFDELLEAEIDWYVATGEPMDKAGAYGIQGAASRWVGRVEGDYFNIVGLPVALVASMLESQDAA